MELLILRCINVFSYGLKALAIAYLLIEKNTPTVPLKLRIPVSNI